MKICIEGDRIYVTRQREIFDGKVFDEIEDELGSIERTSDGLFALQTQCPPEDLLAVREALEQAAKHHWPNEAGWLWLMQGK